MVELDARAGSTAPVNRGVYSTVFLCFLVELCEGLDIQSMGVAAPHLAPAFHLDPGQMGLVMSASTLGLMIGAAWGGRLADSKGRKIVIVGSMMMLGLFSLATAYSPDYASLLVVRVLAGVGLGGAFPNLIALVSETVPHRSRVTALGLMYCGLPLGGACAGALMASAGALGWRLIFLVGGVGPLLLVAPLLGYLPDSKSIRQQSDPTGPAPRPERYGVALFGPRTGTTLLLWICYFFTLLAVYLLLNWLPSLLVAKGYSRSEGSTCSMVLNLGAVIGSLLLGKLSDTGHPKSILCVTYTGMAASLIALTIAQGSAIFLAAFAGGFFIIGGQLVLYAMAPTLYAPATRATGVGAAVAVGRMGSVAGPLLAGALLAHGFGPSSVPAAAAPGLLIAFAAILMLVLRQPGHNGIA
jgi:AAHS family 3-hydroxyphenylpropionic acid transporter